MQYLRIWELLIYGLWELSAVVVVIVSSANLDYASHVIQLSYRIYMTKKVMPVDYMF